MPVNIHNSLPDSCGQEANDSSNEPEGYSSPISPDDDCIRPLYPDLSSTTPGNEGLTNAQIILLGSQAIQTLLTGNPQWKEEDTPDLIAAMRWLWAWHVLATQADTKEEFIEMMAFLMMD